MLKKFNGWKPISKIIAIICIAAVISGTAYAATSAYTAISRTLNSDNIQVSATVYTETVIQDDFLGVGSNLWTDPTAIEESKYMNMNEAYMQINYKRNMSANPAYLRYLVLPQWMMFTDDPDKGQSKWESGDYNWESREMQAFFEYLGEFKKSGTEILLNFGNFVTQDMAPWFGIEGSTSEYMRLAPDNLEAWANAICALLKKCEEKAPGVVTYFGFYNEIGGYGSGNFAVFGNKGVYVASMLKILNTKLKDKGLRNKIKIVGLDLTMQDENISLVDKLSDTVDTYTQKTDETHLQGDYDVIAHHYYYQTTEGSPLNGVDAVTQLNKSFLKKTWNKDLMVNEYTSCLGDVWGGYNSSEAGLILNLANNGVSAMASWFYYGAKVPEPSDVYINGTEYNMWLSPAIPDGSNYYQLPAVTNKAKVTRAIDAVANCFGERALFMNYIPNHTQVLKTTIDSGDMRVATFLKGNDMTVIIELNNADKARDITINFDKDINKTFNKFTYTYPDPADYLKCTLYDANAIVPTCQDQVTATDKLNDNVGTDHCLLVYTTLEEIEQVELNEVEVEIKAGDTFDFDVTNIYGTENVRGENDTTTTFDGKVTWSVVVGGGTIDPDGTYHADGVSPGDTIAVKAALNGSDMYAIGIVKIAQIELNNTEVEIEAGGTFNFDVTNIYGTSDVRAEDDTTTTFDSKVNWSVVIPNGTTENAKYGTIDSDGTYRAASDVSVGDVIAIKAEHKDGSGAYALGFIKIVEASGSQGENN